MATRLADRQVETQVAVDQQASFSLAQVMVCPFCGGDFECETARRKDFGILSCHCGQYPMVAGIPIIKKGAIGVAGETVDHLNFLIRAGRCDEALQCMIMPPPPSSPDLAPRWVRSLVSLKGVGRTADWVHRRKVRAWRSDALSVLSKPASQTTVCELLDFYYHRSGYTSNDAYDYFALRFSQPRYLVALSFATVVQRPNRPILDVACGFGHLTRGLLARASGQPVIGVDQTFIGLYLAKNFIGPEAMYVCCMADGLLPFRDGFFSVAFCSDAFHYFKEKTLAFNELKRLAGSDGIIGLIWMHNVKFRRPHDGLPLTPEGYSTLAADMPGPFGGEPNLRCGRLPLD